ncbi:MAG: DUF1294 domain-containing protein [Candidatus Caldarchaeum sp.]|jgi:uncharacterized membrane protein YsdA (DUF1294 family)
MSGRQRIHDYYSILGVGRNASQEEIKRAYRSLVKKYHPDISSHPHAEEIMKVVNEAYRVLGDPIKRKLYDQRLQTIEAQSIRMASATPPTPDRQTADTEVFWRQQEHVRYEGMDVANMFGYVPTTYTVFVILFVLAGLITAPTSGPVWWEGFIGTYIAPIISAIALLMLASSYIGPAGVGYAFYITSPIIFLYILVGAAMTALQMRLAGLNPSMEQVLMATVMAPFRFIHDVLVTSLSNNIEVIIIALSTLNIVAFLAMAWDKRQAQARQWRVRESMLKRFALLGAGLGIMLGAVAFRHKIHKRSFMVHIILSLIINLYFTYMILRGGGLG